MDNIESRLYSLSESEKRELMLSLEEFAQIEGLRDNIPYSFDIGKYAELETLVSSKADSNDVIRHDGTVELTSDWDIGDGNKLVIDELKARDEDGLGLYNDSGSGIFINSSGNIGIGTITQQSKLAINGGLHIGGDSDPGDNNLHLDGKIEIDGELDHDGSSIGFFGVSPVSRQTALTSQLTTITCSDPSSPDYSIADPINNNAYGFTTADEFKTVMSVICNLQNRLLELETKLKNYGLLQ